MNQTTRMIGLCVVCVLTLCRFTAHATETVLSFSGYDSYVLIGTPAALQIDSNNPFTVEGWMSFSDLPWSYYPRELLYSKNTGDSISYVLGFKGDGGLSNQMSAWGGGSWLGNHPVALSLNTWYHLAFSFDGTTMHFYLDGALIGSTAFSFENHVSDAVKFGGYDADSGINGLKSEVRVWDHARTQEQIADAMHFRLDGREFGLRGYWPLNEGSGSEVFDYSGNASTGTVVNGSWTTTEDLTLLDPDAGFLHAFPFKLGNIETGSSRFTNSNEVDLTSFPIPEGYEHYQITVGGETSGIDTNGWISTNTVPPQLSFATPVHDTNVTFYAWFTNSVPSEPLLRSEGKIFFTRVLPAPAVRATLTRERLPSGNAVVYVPALDDGSTGGVANGLVLDVVDRAALAANPGDDTTPNEPYVTLNAEGNYPVQLWLKNEAGNTTVSPATCMVSVVGYSGANVWTGEGSTGAWDDPVNWSSGVPIDGQAVTIGSGNLTLTAPTAALSSFHLNEGVTLSVAGWDSAIQADEIVIAGKLTHLPQTVTEPDPVTGLWIPQHRILLEGTDLTVTATGILDADDRGYMAQAGPGRAIHAYTWGIGGGGGYGGTGGTGFDGQMAGPSTGDPVNPLQPGSGGGGLDVNGGMAGGAIRIDMQGLVHVDGTITACGRDGVYGDQAPAGSGGGIYIGCRSFQGAASGLVRADGGRGHMYSGSGGGGRIALHYNPVVQAGLPRPSVRFSAHAWETSDLIWDHENSWMVKAQMGTLFLTDFALLPEAAEGGVVLDGQRFWHTRFVFDNDVMSWSPTSLTISNCVVGFPAGFVLNVAGDLRLGGGGMANPLAGTMQGGLHLYSAVTNTLYGSQLKVGRDLIVGSDSWMYPFTEGSSPAIVGMQVARNVFIAAGGGIDANEKGYMPQLENLNGPGAGIHGDSGGSYGGLGGGTAVGQTYGLAALPLEPGSPGGWRERGNTCTSAKGGGAIHLLAGGTVQVDGLLSANGGQGWYHLGAAGSGGAIFLVGMQLKGSGTLQAKGGGSETASEESMGGSLRTPGGGGRIAVWVGQPLNVVKDRIATTNASGLVSTDTYKKFTGELNVDVFSSSTDYQPEAGSFGFYVLRGTVLVVR